MTLFRPDSRVFSAFSRVFSVFSTHPLAPGGSGAVPDQILFIKRAASNRNRRVAHLCTGSMWMCLTGTQFENNECLL